MRRTKALALAGLALIIIPGARAVAAGEAADDVHDLVFFGGAQTILVRLHVRVGGRALGAAWGEAVAKLHEHLDAGAVAREAELADAAPVLLGPIAVRAQAPPDPGSDLTFARLDADGDGKLGPVERGRAAAVLRRFDRDDDEALSVAELSTFRDPNAAPAMSAAPEGRGKEGPPVLLLDRTVSRIQMIQQVLTHLDTGGPGGAKRGDHRLGRSEIRLAAPVFRRFDTDRDGTLDAVELLQFLDRGDPAVELTVQLGPRPSIGPAPAEGGETGARPAASARVRMRPGDETMATIEVGDLRIDVRTEDTSWDAARARQVADRLFYDADLNDSQSIDPTEARGQEPFPRLFRLMDRDGDGRVVKGEMNAVLTLLHDLWRGHAVLSVKDRGRLLFANLDASGDGRLGLRELREASDRLASFDRNGDGQVTAAEVPRRFELSLAQDAPPPGFVGGASRPVPAAGPRWFHKMDRNHDGDLSPREFLGPRAEFLRLDADGDGLIDAREALAAG